MNTGRNALCPCGSGKKYKKCCLIKQSDNPRSDAMRETMDELSTLLQNRKFGSLEEVQDIANNFMQQRNEQASDDFHGLSSDQMYRMLYFPFESPELLQFSHSLENCQETPIMSLFGFLADALGDKGLKATATGNLPRGFCRDAKQFLSQHLQYEYKTFTRNINQEQDFFDLHTVRVVAELAGMVKQKKNRYMMSSKCRTLLNKQGLAGVFPILLHAFVSKYNWAYGDTYPEFKIIQQSFAFSLYLFTCYGNEWRSNSFYEDCFIQAYPMILQECDPDDIMDPESQVRHCYSLRCLQRFLGFFGLVETEYTSPKLYDHTCQIKARPLLFEVVKFQPRKMNT